jgi:prepilin-type N-terminal cleavage/methylation domain-containing protein
MRELTLNTADLSKVALPRATVSRSVLLTRPKQSGFTIPELLVAMALIVFIMTILNHTFSAGVRAFRELVAVGDMDEKLRSDAFALAEAIELTNERARGFIEVSLETTAVDREEAAGLREQYEAICATAVDLEARLAAVLDELQNPGHKRILQHSLTALVRLKTSAATMVELLRLLE